MELRDCGRAVGCGSDLMGRYENGNKEETNHSLYCSLYCAFQPGGTFGGGGPDGAA